MTPVWAVVLAAVVAGVVAAVTLQWVPRVRATLSRRSGWWAVPVAALFGAGAGVVARSLGEALLLAALAGAFGVLVVVDLAEHRLPDTVVLPSLGGWFAGAVALAASGFGWAALGTSALASLVLFIGFFIAGLLARGLLGFGDVKLSAVLGALLGWFGWAAFGTGVVAGIVLHGLAALVVLARTRDPRADVPMGPALVVGAAVGVASATVGLPW